jgi:hypothetical protein
MSFSAWFYLLTASALGHLGSALLTSAITIVLSVAGGHVFYLLADRPSLPLSRAIAAFVLTAWEKLRHRLGWGPRPLDATGGSNR